MAGLILLNILHTNMHAAEAPIDPVGPDLLKRLKLSIAFIFRSYLKLNLNWRIFPAVLFGRDSVHFENFTPNHSIHFRSVGVLVDLKALIISFQVNLWLCE